MKIKILLQKEFKELHRTYKIYIIPVIFLLFGLISPVLAKIMPDLLGSLAGDIKVELPPPTWLDAFKQYYKNVTQMGLIVIILSLMGTVTEEKVQDTLIMVLSKPVSRYSFIFSKYISNIILIIASIALSYIACLYNTSILFPGIKIWVTLKATLLFVVYAVFISSLTIFASTLARSSTVAAGISFVGFILFSVLPSLHEYLALYSPGALVRYIDKVLIDAARIEATVPIILITIFLSIGIVAIGSYLFSKQEI